MTTRRVGLAFLAGCCCLSGCASPPKEGKAAAEDLTAATEPRPTEPGTGGREARPADFCKNRPIEVVAEDWDDGTPKLREEVVVDDNGEYINHGLATHWWPNGQKKLEMTFNCGAPQGTKRTWWQNGKPWSVGSFVDGKDHGTWTMWYPDGTKAREFTLDHGAWDGLFSVWYPNGQKRLEVEFVDGLQQGPLTRWDREGNVIFEAEYADGVEQPAPGPATGTPGEPN